jgi:hypothetical protein
MKTHENTKEMENITFEVTKYQRKKGKVTLNLKVCLDENKPRCAEKNCKANMKHRLGAHSNWCPEYRKALKKASPLRLK